MDMSHSASGRYRIAPAPGGLALVQELLNTASAGGSTDLLAVLADAQPWLDGAVADWADATGGAPPPGLALAARDLPRLRALRAAVRRTVADAQVIEAPGGSAEPPAGHTGSAEPPATPQAMPGKPAAPPEQTGTLRLSLGPDGSLTVTPDGAGARWLSSAVLGELHLAREHGVLRRLKTCRNEVCGTAFYDRSRNSSGVWHDVHSCGNTLNLRASRARRGSRRD